MRVQAAAVEPGQERPADELHEPGADDQVGTVALARDGQRLVPVIAAGEVAHLHREGRDACRFGPVEPGDAVAVGADRDDGRAVGRVGARVE